jgi:hypothetical protein
MSEQKINATASSRIALWPCTAGWGRRHGAVGISSSAGGAPCRHGVRSGPPARAIASPAPSWTLVGGWLLTTEAALCVGSGRTHRLRSTATCSSQSGAPSGHTSTTTRCTKSLGGWRASSVTWPSRPTATRTSARLYALSSRRWVLLEKMLSFDHGLICEMLTI